MARAIPLIAKSVLLLAGLIAVTAAAAGSATPAEPAKKTTSSFNILYTATAPSAPVIVPPGGVGVPVGKNVVIRNPYNVPLIQNAGSLHPGR